MKYVIKASTPEDFQRSIVKYLNDQALNYRTQARMAVLKTTKKQAEIRADLTEFYAKFIAELEIEK